MSARPAILRLAVAMSLGGVITVAADSDDANELVAVLDRAGERVEQFFTRAQSLVCLEIVRLLPLTSSWSSDGPGRTVESELRLSWAPGPDGTPSLEAQMLRQLLRVNGRPPRSNDRNNCTEPEQQTEEPQPLSLLLAAKRSEYQFTPAGTARLDARATIMIDFKLRAKVSVDSKMIEGRDDCVSFNVDGGKRGRIWIDAETFDVLRLDESLSGMVDIPLPKQATRGAGASLYWTLERMDTSIRFKRVSFTNPDETLVLPMTMSTFRVTRGSGMPRLRTVTDYTKYQRFLTGGRVVGN
jgi:hypothetical protein